MDRSGTWRLAPAFDVTFSYNPDGLWTSEHQMTLAGKAGGWDRHEVVDALAGGSGIGAASVATIVDDVLAAAAGWPRFAADRGVPTDMAVPIQQHFRMLDT